VAINVITMIGIGPLVTIPLVIAALGGTLALAGWIAGAIVALCDGLVWAELSSRYPGSGGTYVYLRNVFGPDRLGKALAFLFNWQFLLAAPCLLASGYIGFANYAAYLYPALGSNAAAHDAVAVGIGLLTLLLLYRRTAKVAALGAILAGAAILTIALVAAAGLAHARIHLAHAPATFGLGTGFLAGFGSALYITLYDYAGYSDAALVGDEVERPERTIPLAIVLSILIVAALYIALQIGVLAAVPWQSLLDAHHQPTAQAQYVGALVVEHAWGRAAALAVTGLVLITAFASLYGNLFGFSRIAFAAARDNAFLPAFARIHPRKEIPHVALVAIGALSLVASFFTLDQVIAFLTAGIVLIQAVAQIVALGVVRARRAHAPFRMPLYPLPALVALAGWIWAFLASGSAAIALGVGWLLCGAIVYAFVARRQRWWPFALACVAAGALALSAPARATAAPSQWAAWQTSRIATDRGYPVFTVDGKPFFIYGAAFFYERIPRARWRDALLAYRDLGINTIDLYVIWNWHEPADGRFDFTGATDPQRDLAGLLALTHQLGFKIVLRPGPVIRNEWRNGGYPAWLLERAEYDMPLHDVLEGRYPATATLQNARADDAAAQWLRNPTHLHYASQWIRSALDAVAPYSRDVIAIALDDDQGAYLDNDTWPAPHWHAYIGWLRSVVRSAAGPRVPVFVNTYEMKVPAASPAWAWGNWYQGGESEIGSHDLADLDFATGLLQTQAGFPVMQSEFQAGWFQSADEGAPRPSDPANTTIALHELLRDGVHGVVNFPLQDTIYPDGWEAPWANWSYAWGAALNVDLGASARYAPTAAVGAMLRRYGALLARTHVVNDAAIVWPPSLFTPKTLGNADFAAFADATIAMQRACATRGLTCTLVDLKPFDPRSPPHETPLLLPIVITPMLDAKMEPWARARIAALRRSGDLLRDASAVHARTGVMTPGVTLLRADDDSYGFIAAINPSDEARTLGPFRIPLRRRSVILPAFRLAARDGTLVPIGLPMPGLRITASPSAVSPPGFAPPVTSLIQTDGITVAFGANAGARIAVFDAGTGNVATGIGLLRDAVDPESSPSSRDYIAAYTHPILAGTFNRAYDCVGTVGDNTFVTTCTYEAPDLPRGGARFSRRYAIENGALVVSEEFEPHDSLSTARLKSISGFAFAPGDTLLVSSDANALGMLHGTRFTTLRWRSRDVARVVTRQTRGAQIVTLVFARRTIELRLAITTASDPAEARRLLDAKSP